MNSWSRVWSLVLCASLARAQQLSPTFAVEQPVVASAGGSQLAPAITWTGAAYFAVWSDARDARTADLWFQTFDALGAPLALVSRPLWRGAGQQAGPAVESGNGQVLVAWLDDTTCASEVKAQRFSPSGPAAGALLSLSVGACTADRPSLAWDGASACWLVVWGSHGAGREVHGALVAADGTVITSDFVIATGPNGARTPWVTALASGFLVSWIDDRLTVPNVYVASVSSGGVVGTAIQVAPSANGQSSPCVAPFGVGGGALITWLEGTAVLAQQVTSAGLAVGMPQVVTTGSLTEASCAAGPLGSVLVASTDLRAGGTGTYLRTVSAAGTVSAEFDAAPRFSYFGRESPRLAVNGSEALLVVRGPFGYVTGDDVLGGFSRCRERLQATQASSSSPPPATP